MRNVIIRAAAFALVTALLPLTALAAEQRSIAAKVTRLHVIANSDSQSDQAIKLEVRDAVLEAAAGLEESQLSESLEAIRGAAERRLRELGCDCPVRVVLGCEDYPTREYDSFSLPAGRYRSLRVVIGDGGGRNWWCVLFPPLCFASGEEFLEQADAAGLGEEALKLMTADGQDVQIRFRGLELLQKLAHFLF